MQRRRQAQAQIVLQKPATGGEQMIKRLTVAYSARRCGDRVAHRAKAVCGKHEWHAT